MTGVDVRTTLSGNLQFDSLATDTTMERERNFHARRDGWFNVHCL
jgi:hypothetical protein